MPFAVFGGYIVFRNIKNNKEVKEWIGILRESKDAIKELLEEYKRNHPLENQGGHHE